MWLYSLSQGSIDQLGTNDSYHDKTLLNTNLNHIDYSTVFRGH